jgi:dolichyl-phosphate-mannose-protein mannosyltransferase
LIRQSLQTVAKKLRSGGPDISIVLALLALFVVVHRFVECVEIGGDAISKWHFVRQWSFRNKFAHVRWDHHHARMGVNVVAYLFQRVFGRQWWVYHLPPFFMAASQLPVVYAIGRRLAGRSTGLLAGLFVIYLSAVHRNASQLLPDGFAGTYAILVVYLLARFVEAEPQERSSWLVGLSLMAFIGYEAKETFFFFYPGLVLAVWLARRNWRDVAVLCGTLLAGLALETLAYRLLTDYHSRLAIVRGTHGAGGDDEPLELAFSGFVKAFAKLEPDWYLVMLVGLLGAVWLLFFNRNSRAVGRAVALLGLSHVALFSVSTQLFQAPRPRYLDPAIPFAALAAAEVFGAALAKLLAWPRLQGVTAWQRLANMRPAVTAAWVVPVLLCVALLTLRAQSNDPPFSGWAQGRRMAWLTSNTYERNLPISAPARTAKTLMTIYDVYLDDKALARDKKLPNYDDAKQRWRTQAFLVKTPEAYARDTFQELLKAGCVLEIRRSAAPITKRGYADTKRSDPLPARCDQRLRELSR